MKDGMYIILHDYMSASHFINPSTSAPNIKAFETAEWNQSITWTPVPISTKLGMYVTPTEPISTVHNFFQSVLPMLWRFKLLRQRIDITWISVSIFLKAGAFILCLLWPCQRLTRHILQSSKTYSTHQQYPNCSVSNYR
jgi:hypothetical protein